MKKWLLVIVPLVVLAGLITWRLAQKRQESFGQMGPGMGRMQGAGPMKPGTGRMPGGQGGGQPRSGMGRMQGPASVELASPQVRDIVQTFQATGNVESIQTVKISPKVTGRIESISVREGDRIKKGQVLVRIDQADVQAQVRQQQASLAEAKYRLAQAQLNQTPTDTAVATQIRQQEANLASAKAELTQAQKTREAQVEATNASLDDAQRKIDTAAAAVANAAASVRSAEANLENATTKYNRIYALYQQGYVAAQDVDDARTTVSVQQSAVEVARGQLQSATAAQGSAAAQKRSVEQQAHITCAKADADLEAARARVTQANASLEYARANATQSPAYRQNLEALRAGVAVAQASLDSALAKRADTVLCSPLDGVVTARVQDPGGMASPGQAILTVQSVNSLWVTIGVPEDVCMKLHLNQPATVAFDALGGRAFTASVAQINPAADPQSRQFTVRVVLDNSRRLFRTGMFARVTLETEKIKQVLAVPREAIQRGPDGQQYLFAVGKDQTAHQRLVVTGASDANWTGILSGLHETEKVVTMSAMPLRDGQMVMQAQGRRGERGAGQRPGGVPGSGRERRAPADGPRRGARP